MNAQQLHDYIIKPALKYMGGNYYSKDAAFLVLCTSAIESNCGDKIKQDDGPALGPWQMEPDTHCDIWLNCDRLQAPKDGRGCVLAYRIRGLMISPDNDGDTDLIVSPMYACAMARLKYSMDTAPLPDRNDIKAVYEYYKRIYNTEGGASTYEKFLSALASNRIIDVEL
jgi:hypothetical protein